MRWKIKYTSEAEHALLSLDKPVRDRIKKYVKRLEGLSNPRMIGEALKGPMSEFWKYRVGDYRLVCRIDDGVLVILIVKIGHRSDVYKR